MQDSSHGAGQTRPVNSGKLLVEWRLRDRLFPIAVVDEVVPVRDLVVDRAAGRGSTERRNPCSARPGCASFLAERDDELAVIAGCGRTPAGTCGRCRSISRKPVTLPISSLPFPRAQRPASAFDYANCNRAVTALTYSAGHLGLRLLHLLQRAAVFDRHDLAESSAGSPPSCRGSAWPASSRCSARGWRSAACSRSSSMAGHVARRRRRGPCDSMSPPWWCSLSSSSSSSGTGSSSTIAMLQRSAKSPSSSST